MSNITHDDRDGAAFAYGNNWSQTGVYTASATGETGTYTFSNTQPAVVTFENSSPIIAVYYYGFKPSGDGEFGICVDCDYDATKATALSPPAGASSIDGANPPSLLWSQTWEYPDKHQIILTNVQGSDSTYSQVSLDRLVVTVPGTTDTDTDTESGGQNNNSPSSSSVTPAPSQSSSLSPSPSSPPMSSVPSTSSAPPSSISSSPSSKLSPPSSPSSSLTSVSSGFPLTPSSESSQSRPSFVASTPISSGQSGWTIFSTSTLAPPNESVSSPSFSVTSTSRFTSTSVISESASPTPSRHVNTSIIAGAVTGSVVGLLLISLLAFCLLRRRSTRREHAALSSTPFYTPPVAPTISTRASRGTRSQLTSLDSPDGEDTVSPLSHWEINPTYGMPHASSSNQLSEAASTSTSELLSRSEFPPDVPEKGRGEVMPPRRERRVEQDAGLLMRAGQEPEAEATDSEDLWDSSTLPPDYSQATMRERRSVPATIPIQGIRGRPSVYD